MDKTFKQILPESERYCLPSLNEVRFISSRQTLSLALGSCISTIFIGKKENYILGANHIVIAKPGTRSVVAKKSAQDQIDEILYVFKNAYNIETDDLICFHLLGAGHTNKVKDFTVHLTNIKETKNILNNMNKQIVCDSTGHHYFASYSIYKNGLSVFIENKESGIHKSCALDLDALFTLDLASIDFFPASPLEPEDPGFEYLVEQNVIVSITGERKKYIPAFTEINKDT